MRKIVFLAAACLAAPLGGCFEAGLELEDPLPVADAGFDQVRYLDGAGSLVVDLDARASCDPLGLAVEQATWQVIQAPPSSEPVVSSVGTLQGLFEANAPGEYLLALTVMAGERVSQADVLLVDVREGAGEDVVVAPPATDACGVALRD